MNSRGVIPITILAATSLIPWAFAQNIPSQSGGVNMIVSVEGRHGKGVPPVNREDVQVYAGNYWLQVTDWVPLQGDRAALQLFILLDDSSSTSLGSQLEDIRAFIREQPAATAIAIGYMRNGTVDTVQNFTNDHAQAAKALRLPVGSIGASASPYFSLVDLIKRWPGAPGRREVLMISDGIDRFGGNGPANPYVDSAVHETQRAGVVVYTIFVSGVGHYAHSLWSVTWGQSYLAQVAEQTGGEAWSQGFQTPISLAPYLDDLSHRLTEQYLLGFIPKPEKKAGFQRIKLRTELPNVELVGQESVYVPAS